MTPPCSSVSPPSPGASALPRRLLAASAALLSASLLCAIPLSAAQAPGSQEAMRILSVTRTPNGFTALSAHESIAVTVCDDFIIHVLAHSLATSGQVPPQPWMLDPAQACAGAAVHFSETPAALTLATARISVSLSRASGALTYRTLDGHDLLREWGAVPRTYDPGVLNGQSTFATKDRFSPDATEGLYGLGQHQSGAFNYRGTTVELAQNNTDVAIPLLLSSRGYGILWNTAAASLVDNRFPLELSIRSEAQENIDYYFLYGPEMDGLVHLYRTLTGHTPMLPLWAYGFFQSKDRYTSTAELVDVAERYRAEHIPLDAIVQDWFWWARQGDPEFNANFHDLAADLKTLHDAHVHAMLSVWALFDRKSANFAELHANHFDIGDTQVYDASNPAARDFYWNNLPGKLLTQGWDAFWLDSAEPEEAWPHVGDAILRDQHLFLGSGLSYTNVYPFLHTLGVQDHWKADTLDKRVFLLTRSAFLGQQRVGATTWSGDVYSSYWALERQVPAGLNFALSGFPYWTTDIGGYHQPDPGKTQFDPAFEDLYARWFEFGAFCPIFRTHGHRDHNEFWTYRRVEPILLKYDRLRYRLMPYLYSLAWKVTSEDYTIERPLVMDWRTDPRVRDISDQFMFGPALLVSPVLHEAQRTAETRRTLYLPASPRWVDFWTGRSYAGEQSLDVPAPLDVLPLHVRAGSILPLGPEIEYTGQNPAGPIELRVYPGANGHFDLYEDAGDTYAYQHGEHAVIPIAWNDTAGQLTLGARLGAFPSMAAQRTFRIVVVAPGHGTGALPAPAANRQITYAGAAITVSLR